jgi:outer membrane protein assembly factor BamB
MKSPGAAKYPWLVPSATALAATVSLVVWFALSPVQFRIGLRLPGADHGPNGESGGSTNPVFSGRLVQGSGQAITNLPGTWPRFRGAENDGTSRENTKLSHAWQGSDPRELWAIDVGEGYAGAAVRSGRVYVMDYDREKKQDALRCLSLSDGREIWRFAYPDAVKRNHGMSRSVPAVTDKFVVAMGPKCHVVCVDSTTGELRWGLDLVRQFGATVPPWYAAQCPLIDNGAVVLAPGGNDALLLAVELDTGKTLWRTPNPNSRKMTHSSVMPMQIEDERMYIYCANNGVVGVSARDGSLLWETSEWKISIATVPSPLIIPGGRIFFSGGYNAGSLLAQIKKEGSRFTFQTVLKLGPEIFGATQHTPIFYDNHIYGVRADGKFVCLDLQGKVAWASNPGETFGLGGFILADGIILAMNDSGLLRTLEARSDKWNLLSRAQVLKGRESWGPLALAGGRLIARDFTRMVCLDVAAASVGDH